MSAVAFEYTILVGVPDFDLWDAITNEALINQYFMAPISVLELKPGGRIRYGLDAEVICGEITEIEEPLRLVHTFRFTSRQEPETLVRYEIEGKGSALSVLRLTHSGFAERSQTCADISQGWPVILSSLKTLLETGKTLQWPEEAE